MTTARRLAWTAVVVQGVFVVAWVVAGALEPGYSHVEHFVSELGADGAGHPWIVNGALVLQGWALVLLAIAVRQVLPRRAAAIVAAGAIAVAGVGFAAAGLLPLDCLRAADGGCQATWDARDVSWQHSGHIWVSLLARVASLVAAFALAAALWPRPAAVLALSAAFAGVGVGIVLTVAQWSGEGAAQGLWQRWSLGALQLGVLLVAAGVLWAARRELSPSEPAEMRPRDFFGRSWRGDGEVVLRPAWLGRLAPLRFDASRTARWITDEAWVFEDTAAFGNGYVERRRVFCEFVEAARVEVVAGHLPDGASADFEERGYRIHPYRLAVPLGPLLVPVRCRDRHRFDDDGTLHDTIDLSVAGLPIARVEMRVRLVDREPAGAEA